MSEGTSASVLYGSAGQDLRHYLIQGSFPWELGGRALQLGATLEQGKGRFWQANDLTGRASLGLVQRPSWRLYAGLEASFLRRSFDGERALSEGITDSELPTTRTEGKAFDFGLGLYWVSPKLELGISAQHLLASEIRLGERFSTTAPRRLHAFATYILGSRSGWSLRPAAHLRWSSLWGNGQELALGLDYQERYQLRASWELRHSWSLSGTLSLGKFVLGYRWERSLLGAPLRHEALISYRLPRPARSAHPTKYTSIRLL